MHNFGSVAGVAGSLCAAAGNWAARTKEFTADSLAAYINDKGIHRAYTVKQYEELTGTKL